MKKTLFTLIALFALNLLFPFADAKAANVPKIKNVRIRQIVDQTGSASYKIVIIVKNDDNDQVANVAATIIPTSTDAPKPLINSIKMGAYEGVNKNKKRYVNKDVTFSGNALGAIYKVSAKMYDIKGNVIGETFEQLVLVESAKESECEDNFKIKEASVSSSQTNGFFTNLLQFNFADNSDEPKDVSVIIVVKDCKDQLLNIKAKLKNKESSMDYVSSLAVDMKCNYTFVTGAIIVSDECNNEHYWQVETNDKKTIVKEVKELADILKGSY